MCHIGIFKSKMKFIYFDFGHRIIQRHVIKLTYARVFALVNPSDFSYVKYFRTCHVRVLNWRCIECEFLSQIRMPFNELQSLQLQNTTAVKKQQKEAMVFSPF